jgi:hypothetical protein
MDLLQKKFLLPDDELRKKVSNAGPQSKQNNLLITFLFSLPFLALRGNWKGCIRSVRKICQNKFIIPVCNH